MYLLPYAGRVDSNIYAKVQLQKLCTNLAGCMTLIIFIIAPFSLSLGRKAHTSVIYARGKASNYTPKQEKFYGVKTGKFLQKIDKALPEKHTKKLYDLLSREDAAILAQLRTNIFKLNTYLYKINIAKTDKCECRALETVQHFLFLCPR